jgi:hypothetical protein
MRDHAIRSTFALVIRRLVSTLARSLTLPLVVVGVAALWNAAPAVACETYPNSAHCYSETEWNMASSPSEEVFGIYTNLLAYYGSVPHRSGYAAFITDEEWVDFPKFNAQAWVEGGIIIGNYETETTPKYFWARRYNSEENTFLKFVYPGEAPYSTKIGLYIDEPHGANGEWCITWAWDTKPDECFTHFPKSSKRVQTGMEYGDINSSGATNNGYSLPWDEWNNGTWHESWAGAENEAEINWEHIESPLCVSAPIAGHNKGSVAFAVPGC